MPGRRLTLGPPAAAAALALSLAGCGGGPTARAPDRRVELRLDEYRIVPERIEVPAGRITLVARDVGRLTHNVAVVPFARPLAGRRERRYARTATAHPGDVVSAQVTLRPGRYRLVCTIANHDNLGQYAELRVVSPR
jgi:plastocyanin